MLGEEEDLVQVSWPTIVSDRLVISLSVMPRTIAPLEVELSLTWMLLPRPERNS